MKHILITGPSGAGKSTLIRRLLEAWALPYGGFMTKKEAKDESGYHPIYIHPAARSLDQRQFAEENRIGSCDKRIHDKKPEVFETLGLAYLQNRPEGGVIVMDELGFMESQASGFQAAVLELLEGETLVLAAVKSKAETPFLQALHSHPRAKVYALDPKNREELFQTLVKQKPQ